MVDNLSEIDKIRYETYLKERHSLIETKDKGSSALDKALLTLSGGALAISLTFLRQYNSPINSIIFKMGLKIAWASFGISILATLVSLFFAQFAYEKQIDILDNTFL